MGVMDVIDRSGWVQAEDGETIPIPSAANDYSSFDDPTPTPQPEPGTGTIYVRQDALTGLWWALWLSEPGSASCDGLEEDVVAWVNAQPAAEVRLFPPD